MIRIRSLASVSIAAALVLAGCSSDESSSPTTTAPGGQATGITVDMQAVQDSTASLDSIVADVMDKTHIPGVAVAVVYDDQVVYTQGYGVRETGKPDTVDPQTVFQLASLSKPIGSAVVAGLVDNGYLSWTDPVQQYLPDFTLSDPWVGANVTVEDMYAHRSGLPGFAGNDLEQFGFDQATIIDRLKYVPLDPFRITYSYSNFGMTAGGVAAATAANETFAQAAQQQLFGPAGMSSSSFTYADYLARDDKAEGHALVDGTYQAKFPRQPDAQAPAGGASSNVVDLAQWMRLELNHGKLGDQQIIGAEPLDATHSPAVSRTPPGTNVDQPTVFYGLGWNVGQNSRNQLQWDHSGAFSTGAGTTVRLLPQENLGIVVLTNAQPVGAAEAIADTYLDTLFLGSPSQDWLDLWGKRIGSVLAPNKPAAPADAAPAQPLENYAGTYTNDYYGTITISVDGDHLVMAVGPDDAMTFPLEHYDGDVFLWVDAPEIPGTASVATFTVDSSGRATTFELGAAEDAASWNTLTRTG